MTDLDSLQAVRNLRYNVFVKELGWKIEADPKIGLVDAADELNPRIDQVLLGSPIDHPQAPPFPARAELATR